MTHDAQQPLGAAGTFDMRHEVDNGVRHLPESGRADFLQPINIRIADAARISGFSRSDIYRRAGLPDGDPGRIILRKSRGSTLVDMASLRRAIDSLPLAVVKTYGSPVKQGAAA